MQNEIIKKLKDQLREFDTKYSNRRGLCILVCNYIPPKSIFFFESPVYTSSQFDKYLCISRDVKDALIDHAQACANKTVKDIIEFEGITIEDRGEVTNDITV